MKGSLSGSSLTHFTETVVLCRTFCFHSKLLLVKVRENKANNRVFSDCELTYDLVEWQ